MKYQTQKNNLTNAYVRVIYNDGKIIEPLSEHYKNLHRKNLKSATIMSDNHKPLYTLQITNDKLIYRKRNITKPFEQNGSLTFDNPKRCIILATEGKIAFFWDSDVVKEFNSWQNEEPYSKPNLIEGE